MLFISLLGLSAAFVSSTSVPRDVPSALNADLSTVDKDANSFSSSVNNWNGMSSSYAGVENNEQQLEVDLNRSIADIQNSAPFSAAQGQTIVNYFNKTLTPDLSAVCTAIINKQKQLRAAGLWNTAQADLKNINQEIDKLIAALVSKVSSTNQPTLQSDKAKIDSACKPAQSTAGES